VDPDCTIFSAIVHQRVKKEKKGRKMAANKQQKMETGGIEEVVEAPAKAKRRRSKHLHQQRLKKERKKDAKRRRSEAHQRALAEATSLEEERNDSRLAMEAGVAAFEAYYRAQGLCATKDSNGDEELAQVISALLRPLPIAFRVCTDARRAHETEAAMDHVMSLLQDKGVSAQFAGDEAVYWKWCHAWQLPFTDRCVRFPTTIPRG